jgi:hypothetical protein
MMTKERMRQIQNKIKLFLKKIERDENVTIDFGPSKQRYFEYSNRMTVKSTLTPIQKSSEDDKLSKQLGFTQNIIGEEFKSRTGKIYSIVEIRPRNRKYPIIGKSRTGRLYKFPTSHVKESMGGDKLINRNANLKNLLDEEISLI